MAQRKGLDAVSKTLFRPLRRSATALDANGGKFLISRRPRQQYDHDASRWTDVPGFGSPRDAVAGALDHALGSWLDDRCFLRPVGGAHDPILQGTSKEAHPTALTEFVSTAFRDPSCLSEGPSEYDVALDAGFEALKLLQRAQGAVDSTRKFADVIAAVERRTLPDDEEGTASQLSLVPDGEFAAGTLLAAHPALVGPDLQRSLVVLVAVEESGTLGFVVNRPTGLLVKELFTDDVVDPAEAPLFDFIAEERIYNGGPVTGNVAVLHTFYAPGATAIIPDELYVGGTLSELAAIAASGDVNPSMFKVVAGCAGWGRTQLRGEMQEGTWFACEGPGVAPLAMERVSDGSPAAQLKAPSDPDDRDVEYFRALSVECQASWADAVRRLGGEYEALAGLPLEAALVMHGMPTYEEQPHAMAF